MHLPIPTTEAPPPTGPAARRRPRASALHRTADVVVEARGLVKRFGSLHALRGLDLSVRRDEPGALVGGGRIELAFEERVAAMTRPRRPAVSETGNRRGPPTAISAPRVRPPMRRQGAGGEDRTDTSVAVTPTHLAGRPARGEVVVAGDATPTGGAS